MELVKQVKEIFKQSPSNLGKIRKTLSIRNFSKEELSELAIDFTDDCFCEYHYAFDTEVEYVTLKDMHSNYITQAISLLLEFGLDPNTIVEENNVLWNTIWMDAPNTAASVLKLLLENGGDPNHFIPADRETLFDYITFKISYDEYTHEYFHTFQCWLLLMAFGACWGDDEIPITMLEGKSVEIFKEFKLYDYEIEPFTASAG